MEADAHAAMQRQTPSDIDIFHSDNLRGSYVPCMQANKFCNATLLAQRTRCACCTDMRFAASNACRSSLNFAICAGR